MGPAPKTYKLSPTILLVEDSEDSRQVISVSLREKGYQVVLAVNGQEAVNVALNARPDIILMDLNLPIVDGFAATEQIRQHPALSNIPILAITAYDTYGMKDAALEAGCDRYISKPLDFDRVDEILRRILTCS